MTMSLGDILLSIPEENRFLLDTKLEDMKKQHKIARSLPTQWKTVASYLPNIEHDIGGIEYDNHGLELQKYVCITFKYS